MKRKHHFSATVVILVVFILYFFSIYYIVATIDDQIEAKGGLGHAIGDFIGDIKESANR